MMRIVESRLEDLVRGVAFGFFPDQAGSVREVEDLSDGQRSLFHIALTAATLESERGVPRVILLDFLRHNPARSVQAIF